MNRYLAFLLVGLLFASACSADPVTVVEEFQVAVNSQDPEAALELLAEDAAVQFIGIQSRAGKAELESWLAAPADLRDRIEGQPSSSESGVSIESCSISSDMWLFFETNPMSGTCEVVLEGGLITHFAVEFDEKSKENLSESPAADRSDLIATWTALGESPTLATQTRTNYLQFHEDGSATWATSPDDLMTSPDLRRPGAILAWNYEDYVLTLQNQGPSSAGYCEESDEGTYLVKRTDDGGIQFKLLSDSCAFRTYSMHRFGSHWDPYDP